VRVVDSAVTTAAAVRGRLLQIQAGTAPVVGSGSMTWLATDGAARFARVGSIFLGEPLRAETVEIVDL
jgi:glutamate racemase